MFQHHQAQATGLIYSMKGPCSIDAAWWFLAPFCQLDLEIAKEKIAAIEKQGRNKFLERHRGDSLGLFFFFLFMSYVSGLKREGVRGIVVSSCWTADWNWGSSGNLAFRVCPSPPFSGGTTSLYRTGLIPCSIKFTACICLEIEALFYVQFCSSFWQEEPLFNKHGNEWKDHVSWTTGRITIHSLSERFTQSFIC